MSYNDNVTASKNLTQQYIPLKKFWSFIQASTLRYRLL